MRVRLIFDLVNKGAALPFRHQYVITEFIKPYIKPCMNLNLRIVPSCRLVKYFNYF